MANRKNSTGLEDCIINNSKPFTFVDLVVIDEYHHFARTHCTFHFIDLLHKTELALVLLKITTDEHSA